MCICLLLPCQTDNVVDEVSAVVPCLSGRAAKVRNTAPIIIIDGVSRSFVTTYTSCLLILLNQIVS